MGLRNASLKGEVSMTRTSSPDIWENIYQRGEQINRVPQGEHFTFLLKCFQGQCKGKKLLEIGSGVGNNLLFAAQTLGFKVTGIDQARTAIDLSIRFFEETGVPFDQMLRMDAADMTFPDACFDAVIDRAALQQNTFSQCHRIVEQISRVLKPGGFFYLSAISQDHHLFGRGKDLGEGAYENEDEDGIRQFFSNSQIKALLSPKFEIIRWQKHENFDVLHNRRTATIHHLGCVKH